MKGAIYKRLGSKVYWWLPSNYFCVLNAKQSIESKLIHKINESVPEIFNECFSLLAVNNSLLNTKFNIRHDGISIAIINKQTVTSLPYFFFTEMHRWSKLSWLVLKDHILIVTGSDFASKQR